MLRDEVSLSTITLTVFEASAAGITSGPGFFAQAGRALARGWDAAAEFILVMLTLWPFLLGGRLGGAPLAAPSACPSRDRVRSRARLASELA